VEQFVPAIARGSLTQWRHATEGVRDTSNDVLVAAEEFTTMMRVMQAAGFRNPDVARVQAANYSYEKIGREIVLRRLDVGGDFAANTFTAPADGYYWVTAGVRMTADDGGWAVDGYVHLMIYKNAGSVCTKRMLARDSSGGTVADVEATKLVYLAATDTIKVYVQPSEDITVVAGLLYTYL
jgi:hypothetical protein